MGCIVNLTKQYGEARKGHLRYQREEFPRDEKMHVRGIFDTVKREEAYNNTALNR
jgi:hypothetical protein